MHRGERRSIPVKKLGSVSLARYESEVLKKGKAREIQVPCHQVKRVPWVGHNPGDGRRRIAQGRIPKRTGAIIDHIVKINRSPLNRLPSNDHTYVFQDISALVVLREVKHRRRLGVAGVQIFSLLESNNPRCDDAADLSENQEHADAKGDKPQPGRKPLI